MRVLNLGCGRYPNGRGYVPAGSEVVQHDLFRHASYVDVIWDLNVMPWPWRDGEFDLVVAFDVLEHVADFVAAVNECWRITREGGELVLHLPNAEYPLQGWREPGHRRLFTIESMDFFDPTTEWGREYGFYYPRKWRILEKRRDGLELLFRLQKAGTGQ